MAATVGLETWILITVDDGFLARSRSWSWTWLCNHLRAGAGVTLSRLSPFSAIYGSLDSFQTSFTRSLPRTMVRQINSNTQDSKYLSVFCIYYENVWSDGRHDKLAFTFQLSKRNYESSLLPEESCKSFAAAENEFCDLLSLSWDSMSVWPHVMTTRDRVGGRDTESWPDAALATAHTTHRDHRGTHTCDVVSILIFWSVSRGLPQVSIGEIKAWNKMTFFRHWNVYMSPLSIPLCTAHRGYIRHRGGSSHILVQYLVTSPVCYRDSNHSHHITSKWFSNPAL